MGEKDIEEKQLEDFNDVFADIVNVLIFGGRQVVKPSQLENSKDKSVLKTTKGKIAEQERDVFKWWKQCGIRISLFGLENQTESDAYMCFRLYAYDGAAYKSQYKEKNKYPVVTMVLHFDYEKHWEGKKTLCESLRIRDDLKPYVNDYHMNLFEIAWLSDAQVDMFKSDFRFVAEYFVQMRKNKEYKPKPKVIKHVDEVLKLMTSLTGDSRFEEVAVEYAKSKERRKMTMCKALDEIQKRGEIIGEKRGEKSGDFKRMLQIVKNYIEKKKLTQKAACEELSIDYKEYLAAKRFIKKHEMLQEQ